MCLFVVSFCLVAGFDFCWDFGPSTIATKDWMPVSCLQMTSKVLEVVCLDGGHWVHELPDKPESILLHHHIHQVYAGCPFLINMIPLLKTPNRKMKMDWIVFEFLADDIKDVVINNVLSKDGISMQDGTICGVTVFSLIGKSFVAIFGGFWCIRSKLK